MTDMRIARSDLDRLLGRLAAHAEVFAPARDAAGDPAFAKLRDDEPVALDWRNSRLPPKSFLLPQRQEIIRFRDGKEEEPTLPEGETILFGVRPCDARAMRCLDKVFLDGERRDPYYAHLRAKTTVIVLACMRPMSSCFCTSVGGGPGDATGADVLVLELDADLLLRPSTPKGERLLSSVADLLTEAAPASVQEAQERIQAVADQIAPVELDDIARRLHQAYDSPLWEAASRKCLGCGTCSFLCPTCHCFDVADDVRRGTGRRVRTWDCCAYPLFTLHASGHNPRPTPKERWRQRIMHKFRYAAENFGGLFCVGCGRCIRSCPAGMDLRSTLKQIGA